MHRPTVGLIAVVLLALGWFSRGQGDDTLSAACLRVGIVMAILWFAQPQLKNLPRWLIAAIVVGLLVVMRWPRLIVIALPVIVVLWLLGPRAPRERPKAGAGPP